MKVAYFVHDLGDPAVHRRVEMLRSGGAEVRVLGFSRGTPPKEIAGIAPTMLGKTYDARLLHRLGMTAKVFFSVKQVAAAISGSDAVIARQLEMLVIAERARRLCAPSASLAYECLDVHRLMLRKDWVGRSMRSVEGRLLRHCNLLIVSSEGFVREYFTKHHDDLPHILLAENKVLGSDLETAAIEPTSMDGTGPPWRIGWFGNIRCRRSLILLSSLTRKYPGKIEVVIRGRPARTAIPDFDKIVEDNPFISFRGAYNRRTDLSSIYGEVHFAWTMDFFESGGNSDWLLPNRLYEGSLFRAVSLACSTDETGRWLRRQRAGVLVDEPLDQNLAAFFGDLNWAMYQSARAAVGRIPRSALVDTQDECCAVVQSLRATA